MQQEKPQLPVPVFEAAHWRVRFRPSSFKADLIEPINRCWAVVEQNQVQLRGWDFPHIGNSRTERVTGNDWIASWSDYFRYEYWRFFQSGQFIYLFTLDELHPDRRKQLESNMRSQLGYLEKHGQSIDWTKVPGFISFNNFLYTVTEIFEFAARLSGSGIYTGTLSISIQLTGIKGFMLAAEPPRVWLEARTVTEDTLNNQWEIPTHELVSSSADISFKATVWFLQRFGWLQPNFDVLKSDQQRLLKGQW